MGLLVAGALIAGWVDAVIGGGGLILIPLLLGAGYVPTAALATNKLAAVSGTLSAAIVLIKKLGRPEHLWRYVFLALGCSGCGALLASSLSTDVMRPVVIVLLVSVGIFLTFRRDFGQASMPVTARPRIALGLAGVIAFYDGIFGPGTGMFLIMLFTATLTGDLLQSTVLAKVVNTATNLGALIVFGMGGHIMWQLGLILAVANIIGAQLGARTVLAGGTRFLRYAVLVLVVVMCAKLIIAQ